MSDLPKRRDVHGVGRRGRLPDDVLVDGPDGRQLREVGNFGPVQGWDSRPGDVSSDGPTGSLLRQRGSDGLARARGYRRVQRFYNVVLVGGLVTAAVTAVFSSLPGQQFALALALPALVVVRLVHVTVEVRGDVLVVDQGWRRWFVPASAVVEVSAARDDLVVSTHRRKITVLALWTQLAMVTGQRSLVRAAAAVHLWAAAHPSGERGRERASGWVVLRDAVVLLVAGQALWLVVEALRPVG